MQHGLFDLEQRYASLSVAGDPLERLNAVIDWEMFRPILSRLDTKERKSNAGRKATCRVLMFKMLVLQQLHGLSDERLQYQVTDRLSFMRFLGLELALNVPDARTVWAFRESLKEHDLLAALFDRLIQSLAELGVELKSGQIIDATFVHAPIQRNTREDNALLKAGAVPIEWGQDGSAKLAHKDLDARWTKKNNQSHYGYKNHINVDKATKLITNHVCTDASVHDSQAVQTVLRSPEAGGKDVWADSAYRSQEQEASLAQSGHISHIHERAYKSKPLSEEQKSRNRDKSSVRVRVEHIFGHMKTSMGGSFVRSIGLARAKLAVGLMNLSYNLVRVETLIRTKVLSFDRVGASKKGQMA